MNSNCAAVTSGMDGDSLPSRNESGCLRGKRKGKDFYLAESNKGKQTLVCHGYVYRRDHHGKNKISWRCIRRDCCAQIKTNKVIDTIVEDNGKGHNHMTDTRKMAKQILRIACKKKAAEDCTAKTQDIIKSELNRFRDLGYSATASSDVKFLKMAMYRTRRKVFPGSDQPDSRRKQEDKNAFASAAQDENPLDVQIPHTQLPQSPLPPPPPPLTLPSSSSPLLPLPPLPPPLSQPTSYFPLSYEEGDQFSLLSGDPENDFVSQNAHSLSIENSHKVETINPEMSFTDSLLCPIAAASSSSSSSSSHGESAGLQSFSSCDIAQNIDNSRDRVDKSLRENTSSIRCYEVIGIHEEMLKDKVRTLAYRRALQENRSHLTGSTVLDVGAGTGILSHFALQAGASKVYAVIASSMAVFAEKILKENNIGSAVTVIHNKIEETDLPTKVDAIISEWMGYNLLYESMLQSVLIARDRYLKPGGEMFPSSVALYLAPISSEEFTDRLKMWKQMKSLYGVSMESLVSLTKESLVAKADIRHLQMEDVLANACKVCDLDLRTMSHEEAMHIKSDFSFKCYGHSTVHAFATWFSVSFPGTVVLDTSPYALPTHWGQIVLYLRSPFNVRQDSEIHGLFHMRPSTQNHRVWDITIEFQLNKGKKHIQNWQCSDV